MSLDYTGNTVDIGESDVYPSSCSYSVVANTADYIGPIQAITLVVPSASKQISISAEAAHLVFGAGGDAGRASPWSDPHYYFTRSSGTGTTQLVARTVTVDPAMVWGIDRLSAANLVASMEAVDPAVARLERGLVRQGERARRSLSDLGRDPPDRRHPELRAVPSGERADHAVHGDQARPRARRRDHRAVAARGDNVYRA